MTSTIVGTASKQQVVILGAGVAGLAMGYCLSRSGKYHVTVIEQASMSGGLCGSFEYNNFVLDYGAHKLYSTIPGVLEEITKLMGDRLIKLPKKNRIFLQGHLLNYPLQLGNLMKVMGLGTFFRLGFGYAVSLLQGLFHKQPPRSYEEYMIKFFGAPAYKLVFEPLADKVWGNPSELHPEMARTRVPASGGFEIILKLLGLKKETSDTNAEYFFYPRKGFGDWPQKLREGIEAVGGEVVLNARITDMKKNGKKVVSIMGQTNGTSRVFPSDTIISTIPLSVLSRYIFSENTQTAHSVDQLQFRHLILVYLFIKRPMVLNDQWIFFPERKFLFSRIFEQKQMNPQLGPADQTAICCDFTCTEDSWQWAADDAQLAQKCIQGLKEAGFIQPEEVVAHLVKRYRNFYPRYDLEYPRKMKAASDQLKQIDNLLLTGRLGMYNYNNSDHCYDMARFISNKMEEGISHRQVWEALEDRVRSYKIVD
jgi:protoporphyrinogen oxidase